MTETTRIRAAVLFDGNTIMRNQVVETHGDRIVGLKDCRGAGTNEYDHEAHFMMPGMIDSHVHASGYRSGLPAGNPHSAAKDFVRMCLLNGITTIRDVGNSLDTIHYLKAWLEEHSGPRIYASGPLLDGQVQTWSFTRSVTSPTAAALAIRRLKLEDVDFIKIYQSITPQVFRDLVARAHAESLKVAFHSGAVSAYEGAVHGVDSVEHAINLLEQEYCTNADGANAPVNQLMAWANVIPEDVAHRMGEVMDSTGTMLCPTLLVSRRWSLFKDLLATPTLKWASLTMPYHKYLLKMRTTIGYHIGKKIMATQMPVVDLDKATELQVRKGYRHMCETVRLLHQQGIRIITGTDSPNPSLAPGFSLHDEILELHQMCRISALDCLRSVTSTPAQFLDQPVGVVEPGAYADLLLLSGDPTNSLGHTSSISQVICRGQPVDLAKLRRRLETSLEQIRKGVLA